MNIKLFNLLISLLLINANVAQDFDDEVSVEAVEDTSPTVDIPYESPQLAENNPKVYFAEHFDDSAKFNKRWIKSQAIKEGLTEDIAKYDGEWQVEEPQKDGLVGDKGLVLKSKAKHAAISAALNKPFVFDKKPLIVQYEVMFQDGQECGGAYMKLLSQNVDIKNLKDFHDKTQYTIMFGPDKCGNDNKLHFIFKHRNPLNGTIEEKHCKKTKERLDDVFTDKMPHLFTLKLYPDNTFEILLDKNLINSGSLLEDFQPSVNPEKEIDDPNDKKPDDWDEREKIPDPDATKPNDWNEDAPAQIVDEHAVKPDGWLDDEPTHVPDSDANKPNDWDSDMDGEWEPPLIDNPKCKTAPGCGQWEPPLINNPEFKGKWRAPLIDNPNYKGKWRPKRIPNPDYYEDKEPFKMQTVGAVGFELWSMSKDILFDNIIITDEINVVEEWTAVTYDKKQQKIARDSTTFWGRMMKAMNYHPTAWLLYFVYCSIPIGFYVYYLYFCVKEESVVQKLATLTNDYPILWLVYIVVLGIPVVFVLYLCCKPASSSASQEKEEHRFSAERKKTEEYTEDVLNNDEIKEVPIIDEDKEKNSEPDTDDENDVEEIEENEDEENEKEIEAKASGDGTRKRKVRKE